MIFLSSIFSLQFTRYQKMSTRLSLLLLIFVMAIVTQAAITHLTAKTYQARLQEAPFTLVYFYSSTCKFCKEFTPVFEHLSKNQKMKELGVNFAKIDGPAYEELTTQVEVYSYPSLLFYQKGVDLPVNVRRARELKELIQVVSNLAKTSDHPKLLPITLNLTAQQQIQVKAALFYGQKGSPQFNLWDMIAKRDGFLGWSFVEAAEPKVVIGNNTITDFSNGTEIESELARIFARLHSVNEYSWVTMMQKKKFSIMYFNRHNSKKTKQLLAKIAKEVPDVNFLEIDGNDDQYKHALRAVGVHDQENIVAVDKKYDVLYIAPTPYTEEGLKEFIQQAREHKLDYYKKTEKTQKPNKLTRDNYDAKMGTAQDVLLFLYDKSEPISKELMKLFEFLLLKLKDNKNLLLLRCDVGLNEIQEKLGFVVKPTPKLVFFRNRMKDYPIHFAAKTISFQSVTDFIMENTTFDFEDEWAEL